MDNKRGNVSGIRLVIKTADFNITEAVEGEGRFINLAVRVAAQRIGIGRLGFA